MSLILYADHAGKQVSEKCIILIDFNGNTNTGFSALQKLNICTAHEVTSHIVDTVGSKHDALVLQWRDSLLNDLKDHTQVIFHNEKFIKHNLIAISLNTGSSECCASYKVFPRAIFK